MHAAISAKRLACRAPVIAYQARIAAYDKQGAALNAITQMSDKAPGEADALDRPFATSGLTGPLRCIPMIVKDNFETIGLIGRIRGLSPRQSVHSQTSGHTTQPC